MRALTHRITLAARLAGGGIREIAAPGKPCGHWGSSVRSNVGVVLILELI